MPATFGVHIGPQNIGMNDLRALWRKLDQRGVEWISLWDHFYETTPPPDGKMESFGGLDHFETLTALGALAADTKNARLGVPRPLRRLPQRRACSPRRRPRSITSRAAASRSASAPAGTSGSRAPTAIRSRRSAPASTCSTRRRRSSAACSPRSARRSTASTSRSRTPRACRGRCRSALPIWIGGLGEKRTLRARRALRRRLERRLRLARAVQAAERDARPVVREGRPRPGVDRARVNVVFNVAPDEASEPRLRRELEQQWGFALARVEGGVLAGHAGHRGRARRRVRRGGCRRRQRRAARAVELRSARRLRRDHAARAATRVRREGRRLSRRRPSS